MIPGQNILSMAFGLIADQTLIYYKAISRDTNDIGQYVTVYDTPVNIYGSWQPIPRNLMLKMGLDLQKDYFTFYTSADVIDLERDVTADNVEFRGVLYKVESATDWIQLDGWKSVICVKIVGAN